MTSFLLGCTGCGRCGRCRARSGARRRTRSSARRCTFGRNARGGGVAGHNGLRSITGHIGNDYRRVRIGVGHPGDKDLVQHYVLSDFTKNDRGWVDALIAIIGDNAELLARGQDASFQNKVHLAMVAKGFGQPERDDEPENDDSK